MTDEEDLTAKVDELTARLASVEADLADFLVKANEALTPKEPTPPPQIIYMPPPEAPQVTPPPETSESAPEATPPAAPATTPKLVTSRNIQLKSKNPVRENVRLSPGDQIQLTAQKDASENGLYTVEDDFSLSRIEE